jgi:hypothetical protein
MIWVVHPGSGSDFLHIPDPGSRGQKGTESQIRISNTAFFPFFIDTEYAQNDTYLTLSMY